MLNLLRLGRMTARAELENKAGMIERAFAGQVKNNPSAYTQLIVAGDFARGPTYEIVIAGEKGAADTAAMLRGIRRKFLPGKVVLFRPGGAGTPEITRLAEFTRHQISRNGKATAYVCQDYSCRQPTNDVEKMLELLGVKEAGR